MGWLNSFKKDESTITALANKIFEYSLLCAEPLKKDLEKKYKKNSKEYNLKYIYIVFEFTYFFHHHTSRLVVSQFGAEKRNWLSKELLPIIIKPTIATFYRDVANNVKDEIEKYVYEEFFKAEADYANCTAVYVEWKDDDSDLKLLGTKSKGLVNQLIDNLANIITGNKINTDIIFSNLVFDTVMEILNKKEINDLVFKIVKGP